MKINLRKNEIKNSADVNSVDENTLQKKDSTIFSILTDFNGEKYNTIEDRILNSVGKFINISKLFSEENSKKKYTLSVDKETLKKVNSGEYKILENKDKLNEIFGQVREVKTGKIIKNVPLKEVENIDNLKNISTSLESMAVLQALSNITKKLEVIDQKISQVITELNNDRVAEIQAGYSLLLNALTIENDEKLKKDTLNFAVTKITSGRSKIIEKLKFSINEFSKHNPSIWNSIYREVLSSNYGGKQYALAKEIVEGLIIVQRATFLVTYIYEELEQSKTTLQSLAPFNDLLTKLNNEKTINNLNAYDKTNVDWNITLKNIEQAVKSLPNHSKLKNAEYTIELN